MRRRKASRPVFPAWAGMNRRTQSDDQPDEGVPRVGGDEPFTVNADELRKVVFPAWAGMNRPRFTSALTVQGVPRVGGDEPAYLGCAGSTWMCSPRGRG
ncbi:conserved hypothetical protein (fragment) [Ralstonia solanacearum K60]